MSKYQGINRERKLEIHRTKAEAEAQVRKDKEMFPGWRFSLKFYISLIPPRLGWIVTETKIDSRAPRYRHLLLCVMLISGCAAKNSEISLEYAKQISGKPPHEKISILREICKDESQGENLQIAYYIVFNCRTERFGNWREFE